MQGSTTFYGGMPPGSRPAVVSNSGRRQQWVLALLPVAIVAITSGSLFWLQWAAQRGVTLGYPMPQVQIASPTTHSFTLHQNYQFTASASGRDVSYNWDFGDQSTDYGPSVTHTYQSNGTFVVTVTVSDPAGQSSSVNIDVVVLPPPPQAYFTYSIDGYGYANFDASQSSVDPSTSIVSYQWDFGDGTADITTYPQENHYYYSGGTYQATLIVTDGTGQRSSIAEATFSF